MKSKIFKATFSRISLLSNYSKIVPRPLAIKAIDLKRNKILPRGLMWMTKAKQKRNKNNKIIIINKKNKIKTIRNKTKNKNKNKNKKAKTSTEYQGYPRYFCRFKKQNLVWKNAKKLQPPPLFKFFLKNGAVAWRNFLHFKVVQNFLQFPHEFVNI